LPKRVIDFDAMWGSDKLASCAAWAQAEYAWLYGLADASGCFELTNLRVIWGRVAAIRGNLTLERLEQVFAEFQEKGLLFVWEHEGKRYAHWTGSDVPGRLPPPSWRMRLERFAPPVPKQKLAEYMARFARGRAALAGVGFRGEARQECFDRKENFKFEISDLRQERERTGQAQDSQRMNQRLPGAGSGEDLKFEISDLRQERERTGPAQDSQRMNQRLHGAGCGEDLKCAISDLKEEPERDGRMASSQRSEQRELFADRGEECGDRNSRLTGNGGTGLRIGNSDSGERQRGAAGSAPSGMAHRECGHSGGCRLKGGLEEDQAQDLGLDWNLKGNLAVDGEGRGCLGNAGDFSGGEYREKEITRPTYSNSNSYFDSNSYSKAMSPKELAVARELRVGQGPVCGPAGVKPAVLERIRRRETARAGSRSP
jgi:hypothetical protein